MNPNERRKWKSKITFNYKQNQKKKLRLDDTNYDEKNV